MRGDVREVSFITPRVVMIPDDIPAVLDNLIGSLFKYISCCSLLHFPDLFLSDFLRLLRLPSAHHGIPWTGRPDDHERRGSDPECLLCHHPGWGRFRHVLVRVSLALIGRNLPNCRFTYVLAILATVSLLAAKP